MIGKIFITRSGYDPQRGRHIKDPYLGELPSIGACRPDFRKKLTVGDHIFVVTGKVKGFNQFVAGGFQFAQKMSASEAYGMYPDQRLKSLPDGQLTGNIIVSESGERHPLDDHSHFEERIKNYVVGCNPIRLESDAEIEQGRNETLGALQEILKKKGDRPIDVVGRWGSDLTESQIEKFRNWLEKIKNESA